jgi:hypothetical protein
MVCAKMRRSLNVHLEKRFHLFGLHWAVRGGLDNITDHQNPAVVNSNITKCAYGCARLSWDGPSWRQPSSLSGAARVVLDDGREQVRTAPQFRNPAHGTDKILSLAIAKVTEFKLDNRYRSKVVPPILECAKPA